MLLIDSINMNVTDRCNLNCPYCFYKENLNQKKKEKAINEKKVVAILQNLKKQGFTNINFTGGEPTMTPKNLLLLLRLSKKFGFTTSMITNCTKILPECEQYLDHVILSLDGGAETMLLNRKVRNYSRLTNNVEWYSHHIKKISVNMVITKLNIHNMYEDMLTIQRLFPKNRLTKIELIKVSNNNPLYSLDGLERDFVKEFYSTVGKFNTTTQFKFNLEKSNVFREKLLVNQFLLPIWYSLDSNQWYLVEERKFQLDDIESQYQDEMNRISSKLNRFISEIEGKEYINPYDYLF